MSFFSKLLVPAALLVTLWSCESPLAQVADIAAVNTEARAVSGVPAEVTLVSYRVFSDRSPYLWDDGLSRKVEIIVKSLPGTKTVGLWAKSDLGTWDLIPATFQRQVNAGTEEIWEAYFNNKSSYRDSMGGITLYNPCLEYALKYEVGGKTYWDNNGGKNYTTEAVGSRFWVLGVFSPSVYYRPAGISAYVKNITYSKKVTLVYSTDNWATTKTLAGVFSSQAGNYDIWGFPGLSFPSGTVVKYAVAYDPQGYATIWDNNFGENYTVTF